MRNNVWVQNGSSGSDPLKATVSGNVMYIGNTADNRTAGITGRFNDDGGTGVNGLVTIASLKGYDEASDRWVRARMKAYVSGQGYHLLVGGVIQNTLGLVAQVTRTQVSGENKLMVSVSGDVVHDNGTAVVTNPMVACVATSGGTTMPNVPCIKARVRSTSGNDVMFVGGIGSHAPFSGKGQQLYGGEMIDVPVTNFNAISIFAVRSGDMVSIDGYN